MSSAQPPRSYLPLTSMAFEILVTLASGDRHGYAVLTDIAIRTGEPVRPGSLYRALNRLVADGLVAELDERPDPELDDERRRYYAITRLGRAVAEAAAARLAAQLDSARQARLFDPRRS